MFSACFLYRRACYLLVGLAVLFGLALHSAIGLESSLLAQERTKNLDQETRLESKAKATKPTSNDQQETALSNDQRELLARLDQIIELAKSLMEEIEQNQTDILSISSIRKAEQLESIAKELEKRLQRVPQR